MSYLCMDCIKNRKNYAEFFLPKVHLCNTPITFSLYSDLSCHRQIGFSVSIEIVIEV
jgi:hypothetical protein